MVLLFPTTYSVERACTGVTDIDPKKRELNICEHGDLQVKLSSCVPGFSRLIA